MHTASETIQIAKVSQYLFLGKIQRGGLYGEGTDLELPYKIYNIVKSVEWAYLNGYEGYDRNTFEATLNYLYAICTPYNITAQNLLTKVVIVTNVTGSQLTTENGLLIITENT
jgi:hypothetical protein